jgi:hypothetical protein
MVGCGEDIILFSQFQHYSGIADTFVLDPMELEMSSTQDHELVPKVQQIFRAAHESQRCSIIHILYLDELFCSKTVRMQRILQATRAELGKLANTRTNIFYIAHAFQPFDFPQDILDYFPEKIRLRLPPTWHARSLILRHFAKTVSRSFQCTFAMTRKEFEEACNMKEARM